MHLALDAEKEYMLAKNEMLIVLFLLVSICSSVINLENIGLIIWGYEITLVCS